jgi:hypothetical protein
MKKRAIAAAISFVALTYGIPARLTAPAVLLRPPFLFTAPQQRHKSAKQSPLSLPP